MSPVTTPLEDEIARLIAADGPMRLDRFMELCLGHREHGYYMTRDPFGAAGDFTTAPEVSQMFGELVAVWCIGAWEGMGRPDALQLVELGPGRGTLMADMLRTLAAVPSFDAALTVHLVETSPVLRRAQEHALAGAGRKVFWYDSLAEIGAGPSIVIANEFFDALPVRQFEWRGSGWYERVIGTDRQGRLFPGLAPGPVGADGLAMAGPAATEGDVREWSPARQAAAAALASRLATDPGAALIVDYGHTAQGFGDTLQALKAHKPVAITHRPGETDLTAHVDFADLAREMRRAAVSVWPAMTQRTFLTAMGIEARADVLKRHADAATSSDIDAAVARLTDCDQMGNLFKVCAATSAGTAPPYPFAET